jgi:hypothetical protein
MFSTKCTYCRTLISLKTEEVRVIVAEADANKQSLYTMNCTRCQRVNKIQIKELRRRLPPEIKPVTPETAQPSEATATPEPVAAAKDTDSTPQ